jgi:hypothetical protein
MRLTRRRGGLVALLALNLAGTLIARGQGYSFGRNTVVRCRQGHLFTTWWIPGMSFKSLRLGWWRVQRCPVGKHWSVVRPVKVDSLSGNEARLAKRHHDLRIP